MEISDQEPERVAGRVVLRFGTDGPSSKLETQSKYTRDVVPSLTLETRSKYTRDVVPSFDPGAAVEELGAGSCPAVGRGRAQGQSDLDEGPGLDILRGPSTQKGDRQGTVT